MKSIQNLSLSLLFFCTLSTVSAQNAYYDAVQLSRYLDESGNRFQTSQVDTVEKWAGLLATYLDENAGYTATDVIDAYLGFGEAPFDVENPFFEPLLPEGMLRSSDDGVESLLEVEKQRKSPIAAIGGLKVSRFSDGLAQFLIERSKEEIYVSYFEKLQETFQDYPEFPTLLTQSSEFLQLFESYQYAAMLPALREAIRKDMENVPSKILLLKQLTELDCGNDEGNCKERIAEYEAFFKSGASKLFIATTVLVNQMIEGANPMEMLETLATQPDFVETVADSAAQNFVNGIKMLQFFSSNLQHEPPIGESYEAELEGENEQLWINQKEWKKLNRSSLRVFFGLLYQQPEATEIEFFVNGKAKSLREILGGFAQDFNPIEGFFTTMVDRVSTLNQHLKTIENKKVNGEEFTYRDYYTYYNATLDVLKHLLNMDKIVTGFNVSSNVRKFVNLAELGGEVYFDLYTRNFSAAVLNTVLILDKSMEESFGNSAFRKQFLKYGTFMAALAEAQDAIQVKTVIEATVLPVGSSRIKRDTKRNIALNAYLGAFGSGEYLTDLNAWNPTVGIYAPVGVTFSSGIRQKRKEDSSGKSKYKSGGSWSLFLSVLDIGAVTAFRMDDDSTEALPDLRLQNILAPGVQVVKGAANSPFSWGVGFQAGPMLRRIKGQEGLDPKAIFNNKLNYRVQLFFAVDIPLINFKTEPW